MPGVRIIAACVVGYASQTCSVTMSGAQLRHVYSNRRAASPCVREITYVD